MATITDVQGSGKTPPHDAGVYNRSPSSWPATAHHIATSILTKQFHPSSMSKSIRRLGYALMPQTLRYSYLKEQHPPERALPETAYLDGLRGLAALVVFNYHFFFAFTDYTSIGWGYKSSHYSIIALPFVRLLYDGATCVNLFFIIAGYVCSVKAQRLMTSGEHEKVLRSLWGSVFRRGLRLYLPVLAITFILALMTYLGLFELMRPMIDQRKLYFPGAFSEGGLPRVGSLSGQLSLWAAEMWKLVNIWEPGVFYPQHDPHLWTITFEFRMSMHLYLALLGLSLCRPVVRLLGLAALAVIYLLWNRWEGPLFFLGAAIAQWDVLRQQGMTKELLLSPSSREPVLQPRRHAQLFRVLGYACALYLMSFPIANYKRPAPGFAFLNSLIPRWYGRKEKFPKSVGIAVFIYLLSTAPNKEKSLWHRAMRSNLAQYLGRYMFGLYLVHGPVLHLFGYGIPYVVWSVVGKANTLTWCVGLTIGWAVSLASCLWAAEVFTREVDARIARLIRTWEKWVL